MSKFLIVLLTLFLGSALVAQHPDEPSVLVLDSATGRKYDPSLTANQIRIRSTILPGWGQWTNRQLWKAPLIWGGIAASIYTIVHSGAVHSKYEDAALLRLDGDTTTIDPYVDELSVVTLLSRANRAKSLNTNAIFFLVYTYGINVFDAYTSARVVRESKWHSPTKAAFLSAFFPGLGQMYNRKYWKVPVVWAAIGTGVGFIIYNSQQYHDYRISYICRTDDNPDTEFETESTSLYRTDDLPTLVSYYRRNRDLSYIVTTALYALNIIDAIVDGHLYNLDLSGDISSGLDPVIRPVWNYNWATNANYPGISIKMRF